MGRGILESGLARTERVELELRTADPASPAAGERWLRTDLDSGTDKLAELRWYDGSSVNSISIVATGTTDAGVEEVLRIQTPNGTGVIPAVSPPSDAAYRSQRLRHNGTNHGLGVAAIPASVVDNYEDAASDPPGVYESGETLADYYSGNPGGYTRSTSAVAEDEKALAYDNTSASPDSDRVIYSDAGDGLNTYPDAGDALRVLLKATNFTGFLFGVEPASGPGGYIALLGDSDMRIRRMDSPGSVSDLATSTPTLTAGEWYWGEIGTPSSGDSSISFDLYELNTSDLSRGSSVNSLSTTDSNYTGQAIGARAGTTNLTHTAIDGIEVMSGNDGGGGTSPSTTYASITVTPDVPKALAVDGDYAYVVGKGLSVVDISSPESPSEVATLSESTTGNLYGIDKDGDYLYLASQKPTELVSVDVSDPTNPTYVDAVNISNWGRKVWVEGSHALVTCDGTQETPDPRFHSVDISDPTSLVIEDTIVGSDFNYSFEVSVIGTTAIICARGANQLTMVDVSDMTTLSISGTYTSSNLNYPYGIVINSADSEAFVSCAESDDRIVALDVSTPTSPSELGTFSSAQTDHNYGIDLYNSGATTVFAARDSDDITTVDVSDPTAMNQVGYVEATGSGLGPYDAAASGEYTFSVRRGTNEFIVSGTQ